jgi:hypothetical protein
LQRDGLLTMRQVVLPRELRRGYRLVPDLLRASHPFPYVRRAPRGRLWLPSGQRDERGFLYVPASDFGWRLSSQAGVRPSATYGTLVTPGNNTKGTAVEIMSDLAFDAWGILIGVQANNVSTAIRDTLMDLLSDPAGGTSYTTTLIPNLLFCGINIMTNVPALYFYFPLRIPAGSALAVAASVNNATVGTFRAWCYVFGKPKRPEMCKVGQYVTALGVNTAASRGTVVTPGTTSEGTWTSLGTPTRGHWWWQVGMGIADGNVAGKALALDVGAGTTGNERVILEDVLFTLDSAEACYPSNNQAFPAMAYAEIPANVEIWGRMQNSSTNETNHSMAAYGCGG